MFWGWELWHFHSSLNIDPVCSHSRKKKKIYRQAVACVHNKFYSSFKMVPFGVHPPDLYREAKLAHTGVRAPEWAPGGLSLLLKW